MLVGTGRCRLGIMQVLVGERAGGQPGPPSALHGRGGSGRGEGVELEPRGSGARAGSTLGKEGVPVAAGLTS